MGNALPAMAMQLNSSTWRLSLSQSGAGDVHITVKEKWISNIDGMISQFRPLSIPYLYPKHSLDADVLLTAMVTAQSTSSGLMRATARIFDVYTLVIRWRIPGRYCAYVCSLGRRSDDLARPILRHLRRDP